MKYILIVGVILQMFLYAYKKQEEYEPFYIFKCMIYLFISTVHSVIITIKLPLGACLMCVFYLLDKKNHRIKSRLIISGVIIVILSTLGFNDINIPFQKLYLYSIKPDIEQIDIYTNSTITRKYLFSITNKDDLLNWTTILKESNTYTSWDYKVIPENSGYLLKLQYPTKSVSVVVTPLTANLPNVFIGEKYISYTNILLPDLIDSRFHVKPLSLKMLTHDIEIKDSSILADLWQELLWSKEIDQTSIKTNTSELLGTLYLSESYKMDLYFSSSFDYVKVNNKQTILLSEYLKNKLHEQYILSQLHLVDAFTAYAPVHIHTPPQQTITYSIDLDDTRRYYGIYALNEAENKKILLHNISSINSEYFILRTPYLLLLDEKYPSQYYLMLINQNIPNKHRYVEKDKNILPGSIAICPQNTKFTYTVNSADSSSLYLVTNYYDTPTVIATGTILDSLFLSEKYIAYTLTLDQSNFLCIFDTNLSKTIKYIRIPGSIHMIKVEDNTIHFSIQSQEKSILKEGIFILDTSLKVKNADSSSKSIE